MMRFRGPRRHLWMALFTALILGACVVAPPPAPTADVGLIQTQVALAVGVELTKVADATQTAQASITPTPSDTPEPPTLVPTFTPTEGPVSPTPSPTAVVLPSLTPVVVLCNQAQLVRDVTVEDGTPFEAGAAFTKTWRLKNVGSCTWGSGYGIRFVDGTNLAGKKNYPLPAVVRPGESVDVSVLMTAPEKVGSYRSNWQLVSDKGDLFGVGISGKTSFYADIRVTAVANPDFVYDFAANYCAAKWRSNSGSLPCPGTRGGTNGFVILLDEPKLENRAEDELTLWVRPNHASGGFISGTFPARTIQSGDRFVAWIGCLADSKGCNVRFRLDYINPNGKVINLGEWKESFDGKITQLDIDLADLEGKKVQFILTVEARSDNFSAANAFWFLPSIRNP